MPRGIRYCAKCGAAMELFYDGTRLAPLRCPFGCSQQQQPATPPAEPEPMTEAEAYHAATGDHMDADDAPDDRLAAIAARYPAYDRPEIQSCHDCIAEDVTCYCYHDADEAARAEWERNDDINYLLAEFERLWAALLNAKCDRDDAETDAETANTQRWVEVSRIGSELDRAKDNLARTRKERDALAAQVAKLMRENAESAPLMDVIRDIVVEIHDHEKLIIQEQDYAALVSDISDMIQAINTNNAGVTFLERLERAEKQVAAAREALSISIFPHDSYESQFYVCLEAIQKALAALDKGQSND